MKTYKEYLKSINNNCNITPEMKKKFKDRIRQHIDWVIDYGKQIEELFPRYKGLAKRCELHDADKYSKELKTPYIYITWKYTDSTHKIPNNIDITAATTLHVKNNKHHPEYWCKDKDVVNPNDRDKPNGLIDATNMDDLSIAEMCADWLSVSREKGTNPMKWYEDNLNVRWKFSKNQQNQIVKILTTIWGNNENL